MDRGSVLTPKGIQLSYEDRGDPNHPAIVLIMGLGAPLTTWPEELCEALLEQKFRVIRFDNRDAGLSSRLEDMGQPNIAKLWLQRRLRRQLNSPYRIKHMAKDTLHLMDALNIKRAHIVGASMGGMIGQHLAAKHRKRVISLTSIMSTSSSPGLPGIQLPVMLRMGLRPRTQNQEALAHYLVRLNKLIGSPNEQIDEVHLYENAQRTLNHSSQPAGISRQVAAIIASGDRSKLLKKIKVPTLVIHGSDDPVLPVEGGIDTAEKIPKARLKVIQNMGHHFSAHHIPRINKYLIKHVKKSQK